MMSSSQPHPSGSPSEGVTQAQARNQTNGGSICSRPMGSSNSVSPFSQETGKGSVEKKDGISAAE